MLASAKTKEEPIATPSICRYMTLLKLNLTNLVAVCMSSIKTSRGKDGAIRSLSYKESTQILIVSARGRLVK